MGVRELWERASATGKEVLVCVAAGFAACFFALRFGADEGIAMFFGLVVFAALGAVALWGQFASVGTSPSDIAMNIGIALLVLFGALLVFAIFLDRVNVARSALYGGLATLAAMAITVVRFKRKYK